MAVIIDPLNVVGKGLFENTIIFCPYFRFINDNIDDINQDITNINSNIEDIRQDITNIVGSDLTSIQQKITELTQNIQELDSKIDQ